MGMSGKAQAAKVADDGLFSSNAGVRAKRRY